MGEFTRTSVCGDKNQYTHCFSVKEQLYGEPVARSIQVASAVVGYLHQGEQLLYLKLVAPGQFETIGLSAGAQRIKDGKVGTGRRPLDKVRQLLRNAELARRRRSPK